MNTFHSWSLAVLLTSTLIARPAHAVDTAALANTAMQGAMGMAMITAMDSGFSASHCACLASSGGGCPPKYPAAQCAMMGLNIASMALGVAQALSSNKTKNAVQTKGKPLDFDTFDPETLPDFFADQCAGPDASPFICEPGGLDKAEKELGTLEGMVSDGTITLTGEGSAGLQQAKSRLASLKKGDFGSIAGNGNNFSDFDEGGSGNAGVAVPTGEAGDGGTGAGGDGYMNWAGSSAATAFGKGSGKVGPTGALLDKTDWNGSLDMVDPNTGKSLTLWQRATRRYMGTPDGQRGFTLARIESLRKKSNTTLTDAAAREERKKQVAKKKEPAPYKAVVLSPKEFTKH